MLQDIIAPPVLGVIRNMRAEQDGILLEVLHHVHIVTPDGINRTQRKPDA